jgi:hypothetical protein
MRLDSKVHGTLIKNKDGREIPEDEFIVFRPADNAVPEMLVFYRNLLVKQGASEKQVAAVLDLELRVHEWRRSYPERCKVADVQPGELQT